MSFWKRLFGRGESKTVETVSTTEYTDPPQKLLSDLPWQWSTAAPGDDGSRLFENLRTSLPPIFAAVEQSGRDPVFILADVSEAKWRGLLYLLHRYDTMYYSPEILSGQNPQQETVSGEILYRAPVIGGKTLKVGIYAIEREALASELCGITDVPLPLIKQVQADCPQDMLTVAYFCGLGLGVRHVSRDAKKDKSAPLSLEDLF